MASLRYNAHTHMCIVRYYTQCNFEAVTLNQVAFIAPLTPTLYTVSFIADYPSTNPPTDNNLSLIFHTT